MDHFDLCIVGAGVVGIAIAESFASRAPSSFSILLLDKNNSWGQETSSRNSEVIHAGIYYAPGSLKARLCVEGRQLLYAYCEKHLVPHRKTGKLIVAQEGESDILEFLLKNARENGVENLGLIERSALRRLEPHVNGALAIYSPDSGIMDSHEFMRSLLFRAESAGVQFAPRTRVVSIDVLENGFQVSTECGVENQRENYQFTCARLVNSAGLGAAELAVNIHGMDGKYIPQTYLSRGNYFRLVSKSPFSHLIYPVPEKNGAGLGIHATLDMTGAVRFGPDVELIDVIDYRVNSARQEKFYADIRRYFPSLKREQLVPDYAGIRPKLHAVNNSAPDFMIQDSEVHGLAGLVNLFGIESPGLTASLAIAQYLRTQTDAGLDL